MIRNLINKCLWIATGTAIVAATGTAGMIYYHHHTAKKNIIRWSPDDKFIGRVSTDTSDYSRILSGVYYSPNLRSKININPSNVELYEESYYKELYPDGNTKIYKEYNEDNVLLMEKYWDFQGNELSKSNKTN